MAKLIPLYKVKASIGEAAFEKLLNDFPSGKIYIKKGFLDIESRNRAILADYDLGASRLELAQEYGLSLSTIDNITHRRAKS